MKYGFNLLCTIIMSGIILTSGMNTLLQYGFYKLNQNSIETTQCINKSKSGKKCHGKCYLKKILKQNQDNGNQHKSQFVAKEPMPWFVHPASITINTKWRISLWQYFTDTMSEDFSDNSFRPPEA